MVDGFPFGEAVADSYECPSPELERGLVVQISRDFLGKKMVLGFHFLGNSWDFIGLNGDLRLFRADLCGFPGYPPAHTFT